MTTDTIIMDKLDALLTRASRTETRLVRVADKLGLDIRADKRIEVMPVAGTSVIVYIDSLDVTLHEIERAINSSICYVGLPRGQTYNVMIAIGQPGSCQMVGHINMQRS